jgi:hypothetical protein
MTFYKFLLNVKSLRYLQVTHNFEIKILYFSIKCQSYVRNIYRWHLI